MRLVLLEIQRARGEGVSRSVEKRSTRLLVLTREVSMAQHEYICFSSLARWISWVVGCGWIAGIGEKQWCTYLLLWSVEAAALIKDGVDER